MMVFRGRSDESYGDFGKRMLATADGIAQKIQPTRLGITFTHGLPPVISIIPFKKNRISVISLWVPLDTKIHSMAGDDGPCGIYKVEEALPVAYEKNWPDGELTPGVCLLTLFTRKPGLDHATFIHRWHNSHTPLSLRIHPLWHYNRNVVRERLINSSEPWEGIVEEHFRKRSDLVNPFRFFGNPVRIVSNMIEVYNDTRAFLDYNTIETYLVREIIVKG